MTAEPERVEEVAKGLTRAQREAIIREGAYSARTADDLMRKGLVARHDHARGHAWWGLSRFTSLGEALRAHLLAKEGR